MNKGIEQFKKMASASTNSKLDGRDAFLLWDTFGFPVDLTQLMAEEAGLNVDMAVYEAAMEEAREKARASAKKGAAAEFKFEAEATAYLANAGVGYTDDLPKYMDQDIEGHVCALLTAAGFVEKVEVCCGVVFCSLCIATTPRILPTGVVVVGCGGCGVGSYQLLCRTGWAGG